MTLGIVRSWLASLAAVLVACSVEATDASEECPCTLPGSVCRGGMCVVGGTYGDCINDATACGASDLAVCVISGPSLTSGFGVCSKECEDDSDCWWAVPSATHHATCALVESHDAKYCVIACVDGGCPSGMVCEGEICVFESDGCGPTANPVDESCVCDLGKQWCSSDPQDLDCCEIPGDGGGGGGGGGGSSSGCCRTCTSGKPCGDSCIAAHLDCMQPPGCAC